VRLAIESTINFQARRNGAKASGAFQISRASGTATSASSRVQIPTRKMLLLPGSDRVLLAEAFLILSPSFLDIDELPPWLDAPPQPILKVDPSMVRDVQRR